MLVVVVAVATMTACADGEPDPAPRVRTIDLSGGFDPPPEDDGDAARTEEPLLLTRTRVSPLPPRTYVTESLDPPLTFTVADGWHLVSNFDSTATLSPLASGALELDAPIIGVASISDLTFLGGLWADGDDGVPVPDSASELAALVRRIDWLVTDDIVPVEIGGLAGVAVRYEVRELPDDRATDPAGGQAVMLLGPRDRGWVLAERSRGTLTLLDSPRGVILIEVSSPDDGGADDHFARAAAVIASMRFG